MTYAYTGALPCGCIVAVVVDEPDHRKDVASSVADFIRRGYAVDHRDIAELKQDPTYLRNCGGEHHTPRRRAEAAEQIGAGL